jgi:DNA-binding winged helix-turn-helix (wHTH) protein/tetratricopeptide (TPR) repeat protein
VRFGPFQVDRAAYRVTRDGRPVDLTPKLLDLLLLLADHAGTLVTKEALLDALWPGANVTDNALTQAVSELRQALGDSVSSPQYIKTVARRGYRFVAEIETESPAPASPVEASPEPDSTAIAVLDFTNVSGDPESAWLTAGIPETVSNDLRALGRFRIVDRWRVTEATRRTGGHLQEVAAALRVRLVAIGSFQTFADRIRITARIVDVISGDALADAKVDGRLADIFELQDQVAAQFAAELGAGQVGVDIRRRDTSSLDAYRAVMEGWLRVETLDVRELPKAIADFERAVQIDPHYAVAYNGLANAEFALFESTRADATRSQPLLERAIAHGRKAVELDDSLAEAHGTLALILVSAKDTVTAVREARRAVGLEPGNWRHLFRLGHASWGDERLRAGAATLALYPDFAFAYFQSAMVHVARGHFTEAERVLRHGAAIQDRQIGRGERYPALGLHWLLGLVRLAQDDIADAIDEFDRERALAQPHRLYGREYTMQAHLAHGAALLRSATREAAIQCFKSALALYPSQPLARLGVALATGATFDPSSVADPLMRGVALAALGRTQEAEATLLAYLGQAPPGFAGWWLPLEPFVRQDTEKPALTAVLARLAERAR